MTTRAAGIMFVAETGDVLFIQRGAEGDFPGHWCFPGGHIEEGETSEQAAEREAHEEIGPAPYDRLQLWTRQVAADDVRHDAAAWNEADHPRDASGQFTASSVGAKAGAEHHEAEAVRYAKEPAQTGANLARAHQSVAVYYRAALRAYEQGDQTKALAQFNTAQKKLKEIAKLEKAGGIRQARPERKEPENATQHDIARALNRAAARSGNGATEKQVEYLASLIHKSPSAQTDYNDWLLNSSVTLSKSEASALIERYRSRSDAALGDPDAPAGLVASEVDFTTFVAKVREPFVPTLNEESTGYAWARIDAPPEPLHPGARVALARFGMDELGVARAIAAGELTSPQRYGTFYLWAIRITGTGAAYRDAHNEYCWRPADIWLNEDALARCNGLPVVFIHPKKKPKLDSEEFNDRIVGTVFLPFVRGDEIWAVAKIYDEPTIDLLMAEQFSTSPGVVFGADSGNQSLKLKDGTNLLIEGKPALLDHIALVPAGVWDKGGAPSGVETRNDSTATSMEPVMAEEDKAAAEQARTDASAKLDAVLDAVGKLASRMDAMERDDKARRDAAEEKRKDRTRFDAARKDRFGKRHDGESYKDYRARHDADEAAMCDALRKDGCDEAKVREDAARARRDAEDEERRADESFEKWAKEEEGEGAHKDRKDAAEEEARKAAGEKEREDRARKDAAMATENADLRQQLATLQAQMKTLTGEVPEDERNALARAQARADGVAGLFGDRALPPIPGETALAYRKRLAARFQRHSDRFKASRFDGMDDATFATVEDIVYADAAQAAHAPERAAPGTLIPIQERDAAGRMITRFTGDIGAFMAPFMTTGRSGRIIRNPKAA